MPGADVGLDVGLDDGPDAARCARRLVAAQLGEWGVPDLADDAELVVSELVTNATLHGVPPIRLRIGRQWAGGRLEVVDASGVAPQSSSGAPLDTVGRGFTIMAALAAGWRCHPEGAGKVVWCALSTATPDAGSGPWGAGAG